MFVVACQYEYNAACVFFAQETGAEGGPVSVAEADASPSGKARSATVNPPGIRAGATFDVRISAVAGSAGSPVEGDLSTPATTTTLGQCFTVSAVE